MNRRRCHGFSLLETLAAMFLLAVCFAALLRAAGSSIALHTHASDYTQASLWASSLIDRTFVVEFPSEGEHHGEFDKTYRWTMKVTSPPENAIQTTVPMHLYRVDLLVEWNEGGKTMSARYVTLRSVSERPAAKALVFRPDES